MTVCIFVQILCNVSNTGVLGGYSDSLGIEGPGSWVGWQVAITMWLHQYFTVKCRWHLGPTVFREPRNCEQSRWIWPLLWNFTGFRVNTEIPQQRPNSVSLYCCWSCDTQSLRTDTQACWFQWCVYLSWSCCWNYCTDSNQNCAQWQRPTNTLCWSSTRKTNPRWRTAAILKNWKSAISSQTFDRLTRNVAWRRVLALRSGPVGKISNF